MKARQAFVTLLAPCFEYSTSPTSSFTMQPQQLRRQCAIRSLFGRRHLPLTRIVRVALSRLPLLKQSLFRCEVAGELDPPCGRSIVALPPLELQRTSFSRHVLVTTVVSRIVPPLQLSRIAPALMGSQKRGGSTRNFSESASSESHIDAPPLPLGTLRMAFSACQSRPCRRVRRSQQRPFASVSLITFAGIRVVPGESVSVALHARAPEQAAVQGACA